MASRSFTGNPSQIIIEQLVASGVRHLFYNPGSREARFFDTLHSRPETVSYTHLTLPTKA